MDTIFQKIIKAKEDKRKQERLRQERKKLAIELQEQEAQKRDYYQKLQDEKVDVEKLESLSVANFFYSLSGRKSEKLDKEKQEVARAQLHYEEAKEAAAELQEDITQLDQQISDLRDPDVRYQNLLEEKYHYLLDADHESGQQALQLLEQLGNMQDEKTEIAEAIHAGERVKQALSEALSALDSAKNWGTVDMFGGGLISTSLKHSHMDDAQKATNKAQRLLRKFSYELDDIGKSFDTDVKVSGGLTFADYFFDGLIMDWFVQDKINKSEVQVREMYEKIEKTISQLKHLNGKVNQTIAKANNKWEQVVFNAS